MKDPRTLLIYPPLQFAPGAVPKPDGSLSLPYLAGALLADGFEADILDASTGWDGEPLDATFFRAEPLPSGLVRFGLPDADLACRMAAYDVVGVTSIFTAQHSRAVALVRLAKAAAPDRPVVVGGVNARALADRFLDAGADAIFLSEAEAALPAFVRAVADGSPVRGIPGLALRIDGRTVRTARPVPIEDLDRLPMPAWDLLPNRQYWSIGRPHGGRLGPGARYGELMTSRGCPFSCDFCHISQEKGDGSESGEIGRWRAKSVDRVMAEADAIRALGVEYIYVEDDSLLARKSRAFRLFEGFRSRGLRLADVNGVNIAHLFRPAGGGRLEPDVELFGAMAAAGFEDLSLPFESGTQRIIDRYASRKWSLAKCDGASLVRAARMAGLSVSGNYMIGYPDETRAEIEATLRMARVHMDAGLDEANLFIVVPFPGSALFGEALARGWLPADWDPDRFRWFEPAMVNTAVPPDELRAIRDLTWASLNRPDYVAARRAAAVEATVAQP